MIFSKNRYTPVGSSPEGMLFRIMLWQRERTQLRAVGGAVSKGAGLGYGQLCGAASNDRTRAGTAMCFARLMIRRAESIERNVHMFWIYWDTAWSIILGGVMFTTILAHPDAEFVEVRQQRESHLRGTREL